MQIFGEKCVRFYENMQNLRDLIPWKRRKRNAGLTTRVHNKERNRIKSGVMDKRF